ncbi:hypothetical protein LS70_000070 [Helicobacter sp. MIT 11-5569]|uniref:hypothetical protein n=1 Tax=Helicobacter sp. MIT 11-5569 TaxID=1548151 RepID=UPI0010FF3144|nr:hypothetical protein [Helicobacter sp. MIT 11-5569]TLD84999.1 hypothetical protein LS70_000070 [Helicobacter sp. MIT 11-5569]
MTLIIENADSKVLGVLESLKAFNPKLKIQEECPICAAADYTLKPKAEKRLKKAIKEIESKRKKGTLKSFTSIEELRADLES